MGGKKSGALASQNTMLNAMRFNTSGAGQVIPLLFGTQRISGKFIWYGDFTAHKTPGQGKKASKKAGTQYTYTASAQAALCIGPIAGMGKIFQSTGNVDLQRVVEQYTVPGGGGTFACLINTSQSGFFYFDAGVTRTDPYSQGVNDYGSDGPQTLSGTVESVMQETSGAPGAGQYRLAVAGDFSSATYQFSAADAGKLVTIVYYIGFKNQVSSRSGTMHVTVGSAAATIVSGDQFNYANALAYKGLAIILYGTPYTIQSISSAVAVTLTTPFVDSTKPNGTVETVPFTMEGAVGLGVPIEAISLTVFPGSRPQTPWSHLSSFYPGQALNYAGVAHADTLNADLGQAAEFPQMSFEVFGLKLYGGGIIDADPADIIDFLLTDPYDGVGGAQGGGWSADWIDAATFKLFRTYCAANNLFLSLLMDSQKTAADWINDILQMTNSDGFWSEGKLKIVPYGDASIPVNYSRPFIIEDPDLVYVPQTNPIYDLTDDDFLASDNDPVVVQRISAADIYNAVSVEFLNRQNNYNPEIAEFKDEGEIYSSGQLRKEDPQQYHAICNPHTAKLVATMRGKRSVGIRNSPISFSTDWTKGLLDPMDLVTITDPGVQWNKYPARILSIKESEDGQLDFECEEFPWGTAGKTLYPHQQVQPTGTIGLVSPPSVSAPIILEASDRIALLKEYEIWIGVNGGSALFGGARVWLSTDGGASYAPIGKTSGAIMGSLTAALPAASDPDTADTLSVNLTESLGQLASFPQSDTDAFKSLCWIGLPSLSNGDFEVSDTLPPEEWGDNSADALAWSPTPYRGSNAVKITANDRYRGLGLTEIIPCAAGQVVELHAALRYVSGGMQPRVYAAFYSDPAASSGSYLGDVRVNAVLGDNDWHLLSVFGIAPAGTVAMRIFSNCEYIGSPPVASSTIWEVDNIALQSSGELIAYEDASLASANHYDLETRLRRGVYGSNISAHATGARFLRLDDNVFVLPIDPGLVGKVLYFKFTSFNQQGTSEQSLAAVEAYPFVFTGKFFNYQQILDNDATVDSVVASGGASAEIRAYGKVSGAPSLGSSVHITKADGSKLILPAFEQTGFAFETAYYLMYDPFTHNYYTLIDSAQMSIDVFRGKINVSGKAITTLASDGSGGSGSGGGGTGGGSGGGGGMGSSPTALTITGLPSTVSHSDVEDITATLTLADGSTNDVSDLVLWFPTNGSMSGHSITITGLPSSSVRLFAKYAGLTSNTLSATVSGA